MTTKRRKHNPLQPIEFSPDSKELAFSDHHTVIRYDVLTRKVITSLASDAVVSAIQFSPNSRLIAVSSTRGSVQAWNLGSTSKQDIVPRDDQPRSISFADDNTLAVAQPKLVTFHDLRNGTVKQKCAIPEVYSSVGYAGQMYLHAWFTDSAKQIILITHNVVAGSPFVTVDLSSGKVHPWKIEIGFPHVFSAKQSLIAVGRGEIQIYAPDSKRLLRRFGRVTRGRQNAELSSGRYLRAGSRAWDLKTGRAVSFPNDGHFTPDDQLFAIVETRIEKFRVRDYDTKSEPIAQLADISQMA